jgi:hypothetical protein
MILSNESEKKSVGSAKGSKKKEGFFKSKTKPQSSKPIQKPPEDNLMNLEWMTSAKLPNIVKFNKQEKPTIKIEKKISYEEIIESKPTDEKMIVEEEKINTFQEASPKEEENSYYDQKESLFDHTLPPEIMGDSEREIENDPVTNSTHVKDKESINPANPSNLSNLTSFNNITVSSATNNTIAITNNAPKAAENGKIENMGIIANSNTIQAEVNKKFSIPMNIISNSENGNIISNPHSNGSLKSEIAVSQINTNNFTNLNNTTNGYVKKNNKIINDDEDEELPNDTKIVAANPSTSMLPTTTTTKIKIALTSEMQEVISAHNEDGKKSVSSKSFDNKEIITSNNPQSTLELNKDKLNMKVKRIIQTNLKEKAPIAITKSKEEVKSNSTISNVNDNSNSTNIKIIKAHPNKDNKNIVNEFNIQNLSKNQLNQSNRSTNKIINNTTSHSNSSNNDNSNNQSGSNFIINNSLNPTIVNSNSKVIPVSSNNPVRTSLIPCKDSFILHRYP